MIAEHRGGGSDTEVAEAGYRRSGSPRLGRGGILIAIDEPSLTAAAADELLSRAAKAMPVANCSFWLANCLARAGELDRARAVFQRVADHANDVGLLAEEIDPRDGSLLGNFPQAFSHVGLITAAWAIHEATQREEADT